MKTLQIFSNLIFYVEKLRLFILHRMKLTTRKGIRLADFNMFDLLFMRDRFLVHIILADIMRHKNVLNIFIPDSCSFIFCDLRLLFCETFEVLIIHC